MGAGAKAVTHHERMKRKVERLGHSLGLNADKNVKAGMSIWAERRRINVVLSKKGDNGDIKKVGISCMCQDGSGTANVKFFGKREDIDHWPMKGVLVYEGDGFKTEFKGTMSGRGALDYAELEPWLKEYFDI